MKKSYYFKTSYELIYLLSNDVILTSEKIPTGDTGDDFEEEVPETNETETNDATKANNAKTMLGFSFNKETTTDGFENETVIEDTEINIDETPVNVNPVENITPDVPQELPQEIPNDIPAEIVSELNEINEPVIESVE